MSHVTDIIVIVMVDENIELLQKYLKKVYKCTLKQVDDYAGGNKAVQADIYMTAINAFIIPVFYQEFLKLKLEFPESAQLLIKDEHDDKFTLFNYIESGL